MDPAKAEQMAQSLRETGLPVEEFVFSEPSIDRLASTLSRLFAERRITVPDDKDLLDELGTVILRTTPSGRTRIDHHSGRHDDQAVAVALAAHWLMSQPFWGAPTVSNLDALARLRVNRDIGGPRAAGLSAGGNGRGLVSPNRRIMAAQRRPPTGLDRYDRHRHGG